MNKGINELLNECIRLAGLKNDAALARKLHVAAPIISKLRSGTIPLGAVMMIYIHEEIGMSIAEIKAMAGTQPTKAQVMQNRIAVAARRSARYPQAAA